MQAAKAETLTIDRAAEALRFLPRNILHWVPYFYLAVALPVALLLCFLVPPMQTPDDGRHFLRACQIAQGDMLPQIDPTGHTSGGWLPAAAVDFVRDRMNPEYFRQEDHLRTLTDRFEALDRAAQHQPPLSQKEFGVFFTSAIYPPALYLPQSAAIRIARLFSKKIYVWFFSARVVNAISSVLLIFLALRIAPAYQFLLLIPAMLPMSLYQIGSLSGDAEIIAVSILFVALCLRFTQSESLLLRFGLILGLLFLTVTKPVYLPFALLLLAAYERLGWRRAVMFFGIATAIALGAYLGWASLVRPELPMAGQDFPGYDPSVQLHLMIAHPTGFLAVLLRSIQLNGRQYLFDLIGNFGWSDLPLPFWFYEVACCFFAAIFLILLLHLKRTGTVRLLCASVAVLSVVAAIFVAQFLMWTPVHAKAIPMIQGRYFIPLLAILPFFFPSRELLGELSMRILIALCTAFFVLSPCTTLSTVRHYFFPDATLLGRNLQDLPVQAASGACPAVAQWEYAKGWFSIVEVGHANVPGPFRVLITNESGTILAVSDPVLAGANLPLHFPGVSRSKWLVHLWRPNRFGTLEYWLLTGKTVCRFGPALKLKPYHLPDA